MPRFGTAVLFPLPARRFCSPWPVPAASPPRRASRASSCRSRRASRRTPSPGSGRACTARSSASSRRHAGKDRQFVVLCDFNPEGRRSECDDFGACYSLATYLSRLPTETPGVLTVAYVHGEVRRHSVLPVLACREIVFSAQAKLGQVVAAGQDALRCSS